MLLNACRRQRPTISGTAVDAQSKPAYQVHLILEPFLIGIRPQLQAPEQRHLKLSVVLGLLPVALAQVMAQSGVDRGAAPLQLLQGADGRFEDLDRVDCVPGHLVCMGLKIAPVRIRN